VEPTTSPNTTVTVLPAGFRADVVASATGVPQSSQNRALADTAAQQFGQGLGRPVPQDAQNRAPGRLS
jgi:hypothetical protein